MLKAQSGKSRCPAVNGSWFVAPQKSHQAVPPLPWSFRIMVGKTPLKRAPHDFPPREPISLSNPEHVKILEATIDLYLKYDEEIQKGTSKSDMLIKWCVEVQKLQKAIKAKAKKKVEDHLIMMATSELGFQCTSIDNILKWMKNLNNWKPNLIEETQSKCGEYDCVLLFKVCLSKRDFLILLRIPIFNLLYFLQGKSITSSMNMSR
jgi:hypothetical protein